MITCLMVNIWKGRTNMLNRIPFDCSQFIMFESEAAIDICKIKLIYNEYGFIANTNELIDASKLPYLSEYRLQNIIEIVDEEFIGEFDEWEFIQKVPQKIEKFVKATQKLIEEYRIDNFKLLFVEHVKIPFIKNSILVKKTDKSKILSDLYDISPYNFESNGNFYVLETQKIDFTNSIDTSEEKNSYLIEDISDLMYQIINKYSTNIEVNKVELWKMHCMLDEYVRTQIDNKCIAKKLINSLFDLYQFLVSLYIYSANLDIFNELKTIEGYIRRVIE